jgi:hypothetical protein
MKAKDIFGFILLLSLFGVFIWWVDVRMIRVFVAQYQTESFPSVKGEILSGTVTQWTGSKGSIHYRPSFSYRYEVNGQVYEGKRYRYDGHPSFYDEVEANQVVAAHPKGSEIDVYYDPNNSINAVLSRGLDTQDLGFPFVFGSMTFVFLSILVKLGKEIDWQGKGQPIAGGVKIIHDRMTLRVRLPRYQPGVMSSMVAYFLSIIAGAFLQNRHIDYPPIRLGLLTLIIIIIVSMTVYFFLQNKNESGSQDLVIDEGMGTFELPLTYKRKQRKSLAFTDVASVKVEKGRKSFYTVKLEFRNDSPQIVTILNKEKAESFAVWLREKLRIKSESH